MLGTGARLLAGIVAFRLDVKGGAVGLELERFQLGDFGEWRNHVLVSGTGRIFWLYRSSSSSADASDSCSRDGCTELADSWKWSQHFEIWEIENFFQRGKMKHVQRLWDLSKEWAWNIHQLKVKGNYIETFEWNVFVSQFLSSLHRENDPTI